MPSLTDRQQDLLRIICAHREQHGFAPTMRELKVHLRISSMATVFDEVRFLRTRGYLTSSNGARTTRLTPKAIVFVLS